MCGSVEESRESRIPAVNDFEAASLYNIEDVLTNTEFMASIV